jgi:hypothetical protein
MHINDILDLPNLQAVIDRFEAKFVRLGPDDCWEWTAATVGDKYGKLGIEDHLWGAHCLAYLFRHGPMPANYGRGVGKVLCRHKCDNVRCVNPNHIVLGPQRANVAEAVERGLIPLGMDRNHTVLTDAEVRAIRIDTRYQRDIAADYGIGQASVSRIKNKVRRQHV